MKSNKVKKRVYEKILDVFAWCAFFVAIIMAIISTLAYFSGEDNGKEIFGHKILIVNTDSMSKSAISESEKIYFNAGDLIIIRKVEDLTDIKIGDVITFFSYNPESMGKTVSHKIREIKRASNGEVEGIVTYGINTGVNDLVEVKPEHVMGRYVSKVPSAGKVFSVLKTPRGFYLSILIPSVLLIIFFSVKVGKVLGKKEFAKMYSEEVEEMKRNKKASEKTVSSVNDTKQQEVQQSQNQPQTQPAPVVCQTITINYQPMPYAPQPIINQVAPGDKSTPVYQTITIAPMQYAPVPVINQMVGGGVPTTYNPVSVCQMPQSFAPVSIQSQPTSCVPIISQTAGNQTSQTICQNVSGATQPTSCQPTIVQQPIAPVAEQTTSELAVAEDKKEDASESEEDKKEQAIELSENKFNIPKIERKSFAEKIAESKAETQSHFSALHNELTSYKKVNFRVSLRGVSYRTGRTLLAKVGLRGKTLTGYFNLGVKDFNEKIYFQRDMSAVKAYEEVPFAVKIKSDRACKNATKLASAVAERFELKKNDKFKPTDIIQQIKK